MPAKTAKPAAAAAATAATKTYRITKLTVDEAFLADVARLTGEGLPLTKVAKELGTSPGRVAMALLLRDVPVKAVPASKEAFAREVIAARRKGDSWGLLAARYRVTEGTCRAAFSFGAATPFYAIDYRGWNSLPVSPAETERAAKARREVKLSPEGRKHLGREVEAKAAAKRAARKTGVKVTRKEVSAAG